MSKSQDTTLSTSISKTNISKHAGVQASETVLILQGGGSLGLGFDSSGNLWVADQGNSRVLKYTAITSWLEILNSLLR